MSSAPGKFGDGVSRDVTAAEAEDAGLELPALIEALEEQVTAMKTAHEE